MMKQWINTKVVIDMATDEILQKEGFEYEGVLELAAGADKQALDAIFKEVGTSVVPGPATK